MGQIHRRERVGTVNFSDNEFSNKDEKVSYCKDCLDYGFQIPLRNRIYPNDEPVPPDHENWLQCHECGCIVPIYEKKNEAVIKDFVESIENLSYRIVSVES